MVAGLYVGGLYWRSSGRLHGGPDAHTPIDVVRSLGWSTATSKKEKKKLVIIISGVNIGLTNMSFAPSQSIYNLSFWTTTKS